MIPYAQKVEARFWRDSGKGDPNDCWIWAGGLTGKRYGRLNVEGGEHVSAHRYSYELHNGVIPEGLWVQHSCQNKLCVNPNHLRLGRSPLPEATAPRFWRQVSKDAVTGHWIYTGQRSQGGYGRFKVAGKWVRAHRYSYELAHGLLPRGLAVRHACHNRLCVNPAHLILGTNADNGRDRAIKNFAARYTGGIQAVPQQNWFCHPHSEGASIRCTLCGCVGRDHLETIHGYICPEGPHGRPS